MVCMGDQIWKAEPPCAHAHTLHARHTYAHTHTTRTVHSTHYTQNTHTLNCITLFNSAIFFPLNHLLQAVDQSIVYCLSFNLQLFIIKIGKVDVYGRTFIVYPVIRGAFMSCIYCIVSNWSSYLFLSSNFLPRPLNKMGDHIQASVLWNHFKIVLSLMQHILSV